MEWIGIQEEQMAEREESGKLGWFVAGAVLGGAVALLYAPKSGKETRDFINKKKARKYSTKAGKFTTRASRLPTMRLICSSAAGGSSAADTAPENHVPCGAG